MKIKVALHLMPSHKTGICSDYKLSWRIPKDASLEAGIVVFDDKEFILKPGEMSDATIIPLDVGFWRHLKVGDSITAFEGYPKVAEADIIEVINE